MSKTQYDLNLIKAVVFDVDGVLSPVCIPMDENGVPRRMANLRDGYALQLAVKKGLKIAIITGAIDEAIKSRFNNLGIADVFMTSGRKLDILTDWMRQNNIRPSELAYVGDDIPDLECLRLAGLSVAPRDAATEAKEAAFYVTSAVGGRGVARELLEQILKARDKWPVNSNANGL